MTINIYSKKPKLAKIRLAKFYGVSAKQTRLMIPTDKDESLFLKFLPIDEVLEQGFGIAWHKGFGLGDIQELASQIVYMYYKIREPEMWAGKDSIKIRGNKGDVDIYLYREEMIIE